MKLNTKARAGKAVDDWKMTPNWIVEYSKDKQTMHVHINFKVENWFNRPFS